MSKKKKAAISGVSVALVLSTVIAAVTLGASGLTYHSFEYIEKLKAQYAGGTMQIMELAPYEDQGVFGYLVDGSEPVRDWKTVASLFDNRSARVNYASGIFNSLESAGLMSATKDAAPLLKLSSYEECYPWQASSHSDLTETLTLQYPETTRVNGTMERVEDGTGAYDADFSYSLMSDSFKNVFDYNKFKDVVINRCGLKVLDPSKGVKNNVSKVMALDMSNRAIVVFGSTEANWAENNTYNYYYDLASAYKSNNYYTVEDLEPGKTYCLSFESAVTNGKGQLTLIPLDENGKTINYNPNYSKQYWYWSEYFTGTSDGSPATYQFTVSPHSKIKSMQIRFDVSAPETSLKVRNISVYEYNENGSLFNINDYKGTNASVDRIKDTISVAADATEEKAVAYTSGARSADNYYMDCEAGQLYTLTYHVENSGAGYSYAQIYGFDSNYNLVKTFLADEAEIYKSASGTYSVEIQTDSNVVHLGVAFGAKNMTDNKKLNAVFSNVSLVKYRDYVSLGEATHVQVYDHFETGHPEATLDTANIFDYNTWYVSGSNSVKVSDKPGTVKALENGIITLKSGTYAKQSTNYSDSGFIASERLYYIPVNANTNYQISFRPTSDKNTKFTITYYNAEKAYITGQDHTVTVSKDKYEGTEPPINNNKLDSNGFFNGTFTVPDGAEYMQLSFGTTVINQSAYFDNISIYEWRTTKSYFYNLKFTPVNPINFDEEEDYGTPLYTVTDFIPAAIVGQDPLEEGKEYYQIDQYSGQYVKVTSLPAEGTQLYLPGPYYIWEGNYGTEGYYYDRDKAAKNDYYVAEINSDGYIKATADNAPDKTVLYTYTDGTYTLAGLKSATTDLSTGNYYIHINPVTDSFDSLHPYYVSSEIFREASEGETPFFVAELNKYVYVGEGGSYNYHEGGKELLIETSTIFYKGGFKNNNWFKRFVLDCERDNEEDTEVEMAKFDVKVITYTPNYLNLLDYNENSNVTELETALSNFELCVISRGINLSSNPPTQGTYTTDINNNVLTVMNQRIIAENDADTEFMPVVIDLSLKDNSKITNLKQLSTLIRTEEKLNENGETVIAANDESGVTDYVYRFNGSDLPSAVKYVANKFFKGDIDPENQAYKLDEAKFNEVWDAIEYENSLRTTRSKYYPLEEYVSEANIIRHILNYRGLRSVNNKAVIKILEIQPQSSESVLYAKNADKSAKKTIDVRRWFTNNVEQFDAATSDEDKNIHYTEKDKNGNSEVKTTQFEITTMAPHELSGKIEDIAETYDLVYVGTSLEGFTANTTITTGPDAGDVVPDYKDSSLDGLFYASGGDLFESDGEGLLDRSSIAGMYYDDYQHVGNLWYVDSSAAEFRDAGNDITDTKMQELQAFADQGLPVIVSDDVALQDFEGKLKTKVMGKTYYQRKGRKVYLPGFEGNEQYSYEATDNEVHVCLTAQVVGEIPKNTITSFKWYYIDASGTQREIKTENTKKLSFGWFRELFNMPTESTSPNDDYRSIDTNGDGVKDYFFIDINPKSYTGGENADYFCTVDFDFSQCKNSLGASLRYNGLYGNTAKQTVTSNKIHVNKEIRVYTMQYIDNTQNGTIRGYLQDVLNTVHYSATKTYNTNSAYCMFSAVTPIPSDANDYVNYRAAVRNTNTTGASLYEWSEDEITTDWERTGASAEWIPGEKAPLHYRANPGDRRQIDVYMKVIHTVGKDGKPYEVCCYIDSQENGGELMLNKGFIHYFNIPSDDTIDDNYKISAGGQGRFTNKYTDRDTRTTDTDPDSKRTISGYKLYLKDANDLKVNNAEGYKDTEGGYTLTGRDADGNDITGLPTVINTRAAIRSNRIDNCSNMYDFLSTSISSLRNVMTQNQVERSDGMYRELLTQYVNLSEPVIEMVENEEPLEYPDILVSGTLQFSFRVTNKTELDTLNSRYTCSLYVDDNGDGQYANDEIVDATITGGGDNGAGGLRTSSAANGDFVYTLTYKFPRGETGIKPWRMKVSKIGEESAHTSYTAYSFIRTATSKPAELKALQILAGDWDPDYLDVHNYPEGYSKLPGEKDDPYHSNAFKGSVFLSDIYVDPELTTINKDHNAYMTRTIYYKENGVVTPSTANEKYSYKKGRTVDHVRFEVGQDYVLDIYFTNVNYVNNNYESGENNILDGYDMMILGYGDLYGKMGLGYTKSSVDIAETLGFNQGAAMKLESIINSGEQPVLFCHDTLTANVNFVNYWANDVLSFGNKAVNEIANFGNKVGSYIEATWDFLFGSEHEFKVDDSDWNEYNSDIHTSRIKQGYYANLILRDPLGQDRFGISAKIKQRTNYTYNDDNLKAGHSYNNIYDDTKTGDKSEGQLTIGDYWYYNGTRVVQAHNYIEWKKIYRALKTDEDRTKFADLQKQKGGMALTAYNVLMMEEKGYTISWIPGSDTWDSAASAADAQTQYTSTRKVDLFSHGYTKYTVHRFAKGDLGATYTNRVSQVNKGQITTYPYDINVKDLYSRVETGKQQIKETHEQYFQVNINENDNGEIATVWYCLAPGTVENSKNYTNSFNDIRNNCEDAYYVYTKGNVTYTGAGHTNGFTAFEAKLFFNAIVASGRSEGKVPTVSFYGSSSDFEPMNYLALITTKDEAITSSDNECYYDETSKNVIWRNPVYFRISNSAQSLESAEKREVKFFTDNLASGKEGERIDITDKITIKDGTGKTIAKNQIVPGTYYEINVPDLVYQQMLNNKKVETKIYVEVVLSADETALVQEQAGSELETYEETGVYSMKENAELNICLNGLFNLT